jgi:NAD(P)-dependent dehydrogenase (short-subunit alcohol dehydrogenase family)
MKTVLVTGASRGLGLELARQYVHKTKEGDASKMWRVVVCCRGDPSQELSDVLQPSWRHTLCITLDVACSDAFNSNFRNALERIGRIDVLINNAGVCIGRECAVGNVDYDAWTRSFNTNVMGSMRVLEHCQPHLTSDATVVNISGRMGSIGRVLSGLGASSATTQDVVYRTTKAALNMMTVCAAAEMRTNQKTKSVKVIAVDPGWMNTDMGSRGGTIKAPLEPSESAAGIVALIESLTPEDSGKFLNWRGEEMPW